VRRAGPFLVAGALVACLVLAAAGSPVSPKLRAQASDGHRVVYRIEDRSANGNVAVSTEVVEVRPPYGSRIVRSAGSSRRVRSGQITSRTHLWQLGEDEKIRFGVLRPPGGPTRSASYATLREATRAGLADAIGSDVVLGRSCSWFAYRDPAPDPMTPPTEHDRVESCVDAGGIVLREVWTIGGRAARIVEAVGVTDRAPKRSRFLEDEDPAKVEASEPEGAELLKTQTLVADVEHGREIVPLRLTPPSGWRADRTSVVAVTAGQGSQPVQFLAEAYVRGGRLVVVQLSSSPRFAPPWPTDEGARIDIGEGEGRIVYFVDRVEVRLLSAIGFARVIAPTRAIAIDFIRGLQPAA
jgi:hypothetical protein